MKKKSNQKLSFFTRLLLFINCCFALALLVSYLAPVVDPRKFWPVAFFGIAYPPLLLLNVIFIAYWLIARSKLALVSIITILLGWNALHNNVGFSLWSKAPENSAANVRVLTYNARNFKKYGENDDDSTRHGILQLMRNVKPDVIGVQEYFSRKKGVYAMKDSISGLIGTTYRHIEGSIETESEIMGVAIFSRYPIIAKGTVTVASPNSGVQCIYADIKKGKDIFRFYSVHLQSFLFEQKDYLYIDTVTKSGKADISSTKRLAIKLKRAFLNRAGQVMLVKQHALACPYPYIISGDFNDTPSSFAVNQMEKGIKNSFREKGFGLGRTYNGDFPNYQIDYIMASNQFDVLNYDIIKQNFSDHYPVYADLALK
ncbi:endonuclease/exonuclease/phosphatase family protein [Mucilaginibacter calamicampi]|uniref:Endonuclease/exonuclease/phosphatase family protein n=1 Tax=Mucilaginibacter calamicampi TaxID=1302352 RepID=A0ABW2YW05_9SPHI